MVRYVQYLGDNKVLKNRNFQKYRKRRHIRRPFECEIHSFHLIIHSTFALSFPPPPSSLKYHFTINIVCLCSFLNSVSRLFLSVQNDIYMQSSTHSRSTGISRLAPRRHKKIIRDGTFSPEMCRNHIFAKLNFSILY